MKLHTWALSACLALSGTPAAAQNVGEVTKVQLSGGATSLTLDFPERDYEMILYSTVTDGPDASRTFGYTLSLAGVGKPLALSAAKPAAFTERDRLEAHLRQREQELAVRLRQAGGWRPSQRKVVRPLQVGSVRTFTFEAYGNVTSDRAVQATLIYENSRALAYTDNALPASEDNISAADIQAVLDRFSSHSYTLVTRTFGEPSDVDGNGKVIFLFTPLVDQVGDVAGFYASSSLFPKPQGDGNLADMMYISPTRQLDTYEPLLAHEFQHLVNYNQHVLVHKGDAEEAWLNEALSHYTEDLVGGHVAGGNPDVIQDYLENPGSFSLISDASPLYGGNRGAAYLFLRGLIDDDGTDIPARLVQTARTGISNVEAVTGETFSALFQAFAARLFLSGSGLNEAPRYNYSYKYLTDPATGYRSIPNPREASLSPETSSVSIRVVQAAVTFVRLSGSGSSRRVDIQTEASGAFEALLIPLPRGFLPRLALPVDYFPGIILDAPLPAVFTTGEHTVLSGSVQDAAITRFILSFKPRSGQGDEIQFQFDAPGGRFSQNVIFDASQAGEYTMTFYGGQKDKLLPALGRFPGAIVAEGTGPVVLPVTYFPGITLDVPMPTQYTAGTGASFAGRVTDASLEVLLVVFTPQGGGGEVRVQTRVSGGAFRKGFVFTPEQSGAYQLDIYGGAGGSLPRLGSFSPITVTATGTERVYLPVDFFDNILLDAPLPASFYAGKREVFSGQVAGPNITQLAVSFVPASGGTDIDRFVPVLDGRFSTEIQFENAQAGVYEIRIFGGQAGQSLPFIDRFSPVYVLSSRPAAQLRQTALAWGEVSVGERKSLLLTLLNTGSEDLAVTGITPNRDAFTVSAGSFTISPGDSASAIVTFAPSDTGAVAGALQIATNDPDRQTLQVSLSGFGTAPEPVSPSADFDGDGQVGFTDFLMFAAAFGMQQGQPGYRARYDLNSDGSISFADFLTFAAAFGKPAGG